MALYEKKLLTAREQSELRMAQKGFRDRPRKFVDDEPDPNKLGLIPSRINKEETSQPDFLTSFYDELRVSNKTFKLFSSFPSPLRPTCSTPRTGNNRI